MRRGAHCGSRFWKSDSIKACVDCAGVRNLFPVSGSGVRKDFAWLCLLKTEGPLGPNRPIITRGVGCVDPQSPLAAQVMHLLAARVGDHNAVVISQGTLAKLAGASRRGCKTPLRFSNGNVGSNCVKLAIAAPSMLMSSMIVWFGPDHAMALEPRCSALWWSCRTPNNRIEKTLALNSLFAGFHACSRVNAKCQQGKVSHLQASRLFPEWNPTYRRCTNQPIASRWTKQEPLARSQAPC